MIDLNLCFGSILVVSDTIYIVVVVVVVVRLFMFCFVVIRLHNVSLLSNYLFIYLSKYLRLHLG